MRQSTTTATADLNIAVAAASPELAEQAQALAHRLGLPLNGYGPLNQDVAGPDLRIWSGLLLLTELRLELRQLGPDAPGPIYVELLEGPLAYRRKHGGGRQQALARAVGLKGGHSPTVIDATAGLGRDGFILAELGCRVRLIERSPIIHALLADGLQRAMNDPATAAVIEERIELTLGDAVQLLSALPAPTAEVIYLDPMFPERRKSSLVKKELRLLRRIAGSDPDADQLLLVALSKAKQRVVVKRPRPAPPLPGPKPSFSLEGKRNRFDVYLINQPDQSPALMNDYGP